MKLLSLSAKHGKTLWFLQLEWRENDVDGKIDYIVVAESPRYQPIRRVVDQQWRWKPFGDFFSIHWPFLKSVRFFFFLSNRTSYSRTLLSCSWIAEYMKGTEADSFHISYYIYFILYICNEIMDSHVWSEVDATRGATNQQRANFADGRILRTYNDHAQHNKMVHRNGGNHRNRYRHTSHATAAHSHVRWCESNDKYEYAKFSLTKIKKKSTEKVHANTEAFIFTLFWSNFL